MMTVEMMAKLRRSLIKHEDFKNFPYIDTVGKITIGIGYNLSDRGLSDEWINKQFLEDIQFFYDKLSQFDWFQDLTLDRQIVLVDMAFMGMKRFMSFKRMISALENHDYNKAADEMLDSKWATQVGQRAITLSNAMRSGVYNI